MLEAGASMADFPDGELGDAAELGALSDRVVRVWLRQPGADEARASLQVAGHAAVTGTLPLSAASDWTGALELALPEPAPGAAFECVVGARRLRGRLAPARGRPTALTFGFGSCHMPFGMRDGCIETRDDALIYRRMRGELLRAGAACLLLGGDQLYADYLHGLNVRDDLSDDEDAPPSDAAALAAYRRLYRGFFAERNLRALREALPTLCIWDDHDIFDNWGSTSVKSALDQTLFRAATRAYLEYQHSRNPGGVTRQPPFPWLWAYGDIGVLALDLRGARDADAGSLLGVAQWQWLRDTLNGEARELATMFIVCSVPIAHVARWFTALFDRLPQRVSGSVRDRWSAAAFVDERDRLLRLLFDWQAARPARQVVLLSGDVHAASAFTLRQHSGPGVLQQWTSSAMTTPLVRSQMLFNRIVTRGSSLGERELRVERHALSISHNYGLVRARPLPAGGHHIEFEIRAWQPATRTLRSVARLSAVPSHARA
jgi:phosphodiesterase/alkaline phosphatase D-like protein